jgi:hypothetical protein
MNDPRKCSHSDVDHINEEVLSNFWQTTYIPPKHVLIEFPAGLLFGTEGGGDMCL